MTNRDGRGRPAVRRGLRSLVALAAVVAACGGPPPPPGPGTPQGAVPDLRGVRVMLFPVQSSYGGLGEGMDAELAFALSQRGGEVDWVLPADMERALRTSPGMDTRLEGLPVGDFLRAEVRRVGDPLFGYLRRMGALTDAPVALVPVVARWRPATAEKPAAVEVGAALLAVNSGHVLWFGFVEGAPGSAEDPAALASAADALGRRLLPFSVTRQGPAGER